MTDHVPSDVYEQEKQAHRETRLALRRLEKELDNKHNALLKLESQFEVKRAELEKARDEALMANKVKTNFLANMSHEIRTPLTAIIGFAENMVADMLTAEEVKFANKSIVSNSKHLLSVLNEILDISKIEAGQLEVESHRFSLLQVLQDVTNIYASLCEEKGLYFDAHFSDSLPEDIVCDSTRLRQILSNLLSNAVKFTESGKVMLDVDFVSETADLTFKVRDTGIGMNAIQLSNVFVPFAQADSSISRKYGGTGLGMSISKRLAEKLNGNLSAESAPERGTTFVLQLNNVEYFQESITREAEAAELKTLQGDILLIEDNELNQMIVKQKLRMFGLDCHTENNGEAGYQTALAGDFDLILMDIQMPVMDGKEAISILRAVGYNSPVYALTANVLTRDIKEYRKLGFNGYLAKPIDQQELARVLRKHLAAVSSESKQTGLNQLHDIDQIRENFLRELPDYHQKLTQALNENDKKVLITLLHQLNGICGNFELKELTETVSRAYNDLRDNAGPIDDHSHISAVLNQLNQYL